jgi:predicted acyltransferase (DUF342 family)
MAYTINLTDGTVFATITDGTINTSSSMILVGKNYAGYGEFLDENFIHLLENGSNTTAPAAPLTGQLWWDKTNNLLKVYNGAIFKTISAATASASAPVSNVIGDLWYDTVNQQLKVWTGAAFLVVGPGYSTAQGISGAIPETILNNIGATRYITSLYVNNVRVAIVYDGAQFTPEAALLAAFPIIYPGITLSASVSSAVFAGTATNASKLDNLLSSDFMRATANTATTGRLQVNNANGIFIGTSNVVNISQSTNDGLITAPVSGGNLIIQTNVAGTTYTVATALGANGTFAIANAATVGTTLSVAGNITGANVNTGGLVSVTGNVIGGNLVTLGLANVANISVTANVQAGNLRTTGLISATGNITSAANIAGTFFLGNGSQLTGISAAVSVSKISNGTSEANIGASGGNANISIGGTSNVAVFTTSTAFFISDISVSGIQKVGSNAVGNIGSSSNYFNQVFATATTALYADVAERFAADEILEPGTVVELGGIKEITRSTQDLSENVFGVISTRPAYTMNGGAGENDTHPPVAMTGRVPVKCVGTVRKGDRLVSAGDGVARAAQSGEATAFNVIGRSLENKTTTDIGVIEAIVTIK